MEADATVQAYRSHPTDTGSTSVQVAQLSQRINELTAHLKDHRKDFDSRSGLLKMVGRRRRLLNYLSSTDPDAYLKLIKDLGLRK